MMYIHIYAFRIFTYTVCVYQAFLVKSPPDKRKILASLHIHVKLSNFWVFMYFLSIIYKSEIHFSRRHLQ